MREREVVGEVRVGVTGGRDFADRETVWRALDAVARKHPAFTLVHGDASGADAHAQAWADARGQPVERHPARWDRLGRRAGPVRNQAMVDFGLDGCVAFQGGRGTADMVARCVRAGVPVWRIETAPTGPVR